MENQKIRQPLPKKRLKAYDRAMHIHTNKTREDDNIFEGEYQVKIPASVAISKEDMGFRRFLLRGNVKVEAEWTRMAIACNILKLFHKMSTGRLGTCLAVPTGFLEDSA